jgi:hypothetical protein
LPGSFGGAGWVLEKEQLLASTYMRLLVVSLTRHWVAWAPERAGRRKKSAATGERVGKLNFNIKSVSYRFEKIGGILPRSRLLNIGLWNGVLVDISTFLEVPELLI